MSIITCQFCEAYYDTDFYAEHEGECEMNPENQEPPHNPLPVIV